MKVQKYQPNIKTVYATLNRKEPFSKNDKTKFTIQEQNLIRGLQLRDKKSLNDAIQTYTNYEKESKRKLKSLNSSIRKYIESKYPKLGGGIEHEVSEYEAPKSKGEERRKYKLKTVEFIAKRENKIKNSKTYMRVKKSSIKYPNASLGEHRHGVNSKWSENWRVKHGFSRNYK